VFEWAKDLRGPARTERVRRQHRARGQRAHHLGRAQGRARGAQGGLLPSRARFRKLLALADAARGRRSRGRERELRQGRARGADPEARAAQAPQGCDLDWQRLAEHNRGRRVHEHRRAGQVGRAGSPGPALPRKTAHMVPAAPVGSHGPALPRQSARMVRPPAATQRLWAGRDRDLDAVHGGAGAHVAGDPRIEHVHVRALLLELWPTPLR
jgi:hypothetical protein